jgi:hypothetical protein
MGPVMLAILVAVVFWLGKTLAMILIYASPDNTPHTLHASLYLLGSSIFIFAVYYNTGDTLNRIMKWVFSIFGIYAVLNLLGFSYASLFSNPIEDEKDAAAAFIFFTSGLLIGTGTFFMLKNAKPGVAHA